MTATINRAIFRLKALLCIVLILHGQLIVSGCGQWGGISPVPAEVYRVVLSADHPLTRALAGTSFAGATAFEALPSHQQFRLVFPDSAREVSGNYSYDGREFTINRFYFENRSRSATIEMDAQRRVTAISTSDGYRWKRSDDDSARLVGDFGGGVEAYLAANADLVEVAREMDARTGPSAPAQPSSATTPALHGPVGSDKPAGAALSAGVRTVLAVAASIWAPVVGVLHPLVTIFTTAAVLEIIFTTRFDGVWTAANAGSDLTVTIQGGRITKLVDESSNQELSIADTRLESLTGNRVRWRVLANVLGQNTQVEFTFDMQELSNGTLEGTLTALGDNFARVPVTMTRAN